MLLNEDQIVELEIDLEELKKNKLDESFLSMFGSALKLLMGYMFGPHSLFLVDIELRGEKKMLNPSPELLEERRDILKHLKSMDSMIQKHLNQKLLWIKP